MRPSQKLSSVTPLSSPSSRTSQVRLFPNCHPLPNTNQETLQHPTPSPTTYSTIWETSLELNHTSESAATPKTTHSIMLASKKPSTGLTTLPDPSITQPRSSLAHHTSTPTAPGQTRSSSMASTWDSEATTQLDGRLYSKLCRWHVRLCKVESFCGGNTAMSQISIRLRRKGLFVHQPGMKVHTSNNG